VVPKPKPALHPKQPTAYRIPFDYCYKIDTSLEFAIIQIGANILDQFDLDGFPTLVRFLRWFISCKRVPGR
jgi:hypothetical protein